jgi:hypothetical protein
LVIISHCVSDTNFELDSPKRRVTNFELKSIGRIEVWDGIIESEHEDGTEAFVSQNHTFKVVKFNDNEVNLESSESDEESFSESSEFIEFL